MFPTVIADDDDECRTAVRENRAKTIKNADIVGNGML